MINKERKKSFSKNDNKYLTTAKKLLAMVGSNNINQLLNCFTRVRFHVNDKTIIDDQKIQALELVKGINWNGNELQVVIGPDAFKVKDEIEKLRKTNTDFEIKNAKEMTDLKKKSFGQRFIGAANGIIVPLIPLFIASGFISAITALLSAPSIALIQGEPEEGKFVTDMDLMSGLMYILSNSGIALLSIFFCYSTVKYFNGNPIIGIFIGLLITSRYFLRTFGDDTGAWILYKSGEFKISIESYNNNIIPAVGAGLTYVYLDRFFKKWMPAAIDMVARPVLAVTITFFVSFFVVMPLLSIIIYGFGEVALWFFHWPLGIGGFVVGFTYQPLNALGLSWPVFYPLDIPWFKGEGPMGPQNTMDGSTLSLIGVMFALYLKETQFKKKNEIVSLGSSLPFGITEPTVFGVLLKKPKAFWLANLGSGIVGILMVNFVARYQFGGMGFLGVVGFADDYKRMGLFLAIALFGIVLNFVLVYFFYHDKKSELKLTKQSLRYLVNYVWINNRKNNQLNQDNQKVSYFKLRQELHEVLQEAKTNHKVNQQYYQTYVHYHKELNKLLKHQQQFERKQNKLMDKISKAKQENQKQSLELKLTRLQKMYQDKPELETKVKLAKENLDLASQNLLDLNEKIFDKVQQIVEGFLSKYQIDYDQQSKLINKLWNGINNNLIISEVEETKKDQIDKSEYYQTKNKFLLKFLPKII